jgi:galactose mutarotase-like enzyme
LADDRAVELPGWDGEELHLLESSTARVWVAPSHGGSVVGLAIATASGWRQVLHHGSALQAWERPTRFGCPVLFPFPGLVHDAAYWWEGQRYRLPVNAPDGTSFAHGFAHDRGWQVVERDDQQIVMQLETPGCLNEDERRGYPFAVTLRQEISMGEDGLSIELVARNEGVEPAPVGLGVHPYFAMSFLGGERSDLRFETPAASGMSQPGEPIRLASVGQELHLRTLPLSPTVVHMRGKDGEVVLHLEHGVSDLAVFAPDDGRSVSLEPTSCALSAGSLLTAAESVAHAVLRLAPGAERRVAVRISAKCWNRSSGHGVE